MAQRSGHLDVSPEYVWVSESMEKKGVSNSRSLQVNRFTKNEVVFEAVNAGS